MDIDSPSFIYILAGFTLLAVLVLAFIQLARVKRKQRRTAVQVEERRGTPRGATTGPAPRDPGIRR